ncbi:multicopper oxidase [Plenodomus tracheiphilus IPT5]|uniref:Multicopper oxidase n=1 Tax=Plenodomus tracheiphilus IPT5 TaxID=1408161 RepID=A0A6A7B410_9PLEO|nr:multicopper oxidase [Plenodomus tracheiphilus IPT5]
MPYQDGGPTVDQYEEPCWVSKGTVNLTPSLSNFEQCGNSQWVLVDCPRLPIDGVPKRQSNTSYSRSSVVPPYPYSTGTVYYPTGTVYASHHTKSTTTYSHRPTGTSTPTADAACPNMPDTGVTRTYDLHVAYQTIAPDGVTRNGLTINGQFPGPLIEANWGDWILFKVTNDLTDEGTSVHAHGLFQKETSWYDGVPAIDQCPITPNGEVYEMLFRADRYGSSWYHSHYSAQHSGGVSSRYGHLRPETRKERYRRWAQTTPSNNMLINGRMNCPCANTTLPCISNAVISKLRFESGKMHLLRLIETAADATVKFSIDGHQLKVIAVDYNPVDPYTTNVVTLTIGRRADVIVKAVGTAGETFWMRSQAARGSEWGRCSLIDGISPDALAAVYYENTDTDSVPSTTSSVTPGQLADCLGEDLPAFTPLCPIAVGKPTATERIDIDFRSNGTSFLWFVNNSTFRGDYNSPPLLKAKKADSVRLHLVNHGLAGAHPINLHSHDFHVLAEGFGDRDGTVVNSANTQRRDDP